jgi:ATP-dependent DNA ligase
VLEQNLPVDTAFQVRDDWSPMLAHLAAALPRGRDWLYEPKWDGFRGLVVKRGSSIRILSRNRRALEPYFPDWRRPLSRASPRTVRWTGNCWRCEMASPSSRPFSSGSGDDSAPRCSSWRSTSWS